MTRMAACPFRPRLRIGAKPATSRALAAMAMSVALSASGGGEASGDEAFVVVHTAEFGGSSDQKWLEYPDAEPIECRALERSTDADGVDFATSRGPWWIDTNHAPPGLGYLHLIAFAYHHDWSADGLIPDASTGSRPLDLRDAEVTVRWRAPALRMSADATLTLWFQTRTSPVDAVAPRFVKYLLTSQSLPVRPPPSQWREDTLRLSAVDGDYACLGGNADRANVYGCDVPAVAALRDWNTDLGLVIFFRDASSASEITGAIDLDRSTIRVPQDNLATHRLAAPSIVSAGGSTCRST